MQEITLHNILLDSKQEPEALEKACMNINPNEEPAWTKDENLFTWLKKIQYCYVK